MLTKTGDKIVVENHLRIITVVHKVRYSLIERKDGKVFLTTIFEMLKNYEFDGFGIMTNPPRDFFDGQYVLANYENENAYLIANFKLTQNYVHITEYRLNLV